jgi:hypothetical protein
MKNSVQLFFKDCQNEKTLNLKLYFIVNIYLVSHIEIRYLNLNYFDQNYVFEMIRQKIIFKFSSSENLRIGWGRFSKGINLKIQFNITD